ncbi:leucine-rich repeat-containing protein 41 isoform X1 [Phodopus roborovskii]|uniref:Leucine-rich repeat-containing protein 41 n=2 Tax=Phodopus roborovskii TaxID=109678 RepID=A0AAU9ZDI4_PHORO|nr:leucine-rich repeat-containing protein 41 isoform X1 [Phodopus roborovskii]CAH6790699.1 Lrrc41 [Phodopus roborovskii]
MAAPEAWRARSCWFCEVAAATTMEATSREAAPAKSSASGPSAPPALFELCGRAVSAHMGVLESGVWALPGPILQSILPLLNIYYLERIEETALKKGLSTQAIWRRLWDELMKTRPSGLESVTCWRAKFMEAFFSHVLRGTIDVSSDKRLCDQRFSPLLHSSRHVRQLTICNMLQGATELVAEPNRRVLETLASSLHTLKFRHLLFSDVAAQQSLRQLLHQLIHHGAVSQVSLYSWPVPESALFILILTMSAGFWQPGPGSLPCRLCGEASRGRAPSRDEGSLLLGSRRPRRDAAERCAAALMATRRKSEVKQMPRAVPTTRVTRRSTQESLAIGGTDSKRELYPPATSYEASGTKQPSSAPAATSSASSSTSSKRAPASSASQPKPLKRFKRAAGKKGARTRQGSGAESEDLYDFVFIVAGEKEDGEEMEIGEVACGALDGSDPSCLGLPALEASQRFRSISTLELFTVPLSTEAALTLCHLLSSWVSLESLTLSYNGLGSNIFRLLDSLRALSGQAGCRLRALHLSDLFSPLPILELTRAIVRALPLLRVLSIRVDHPSQRDNPAVPENAGTPSHIIGDDEIPENCLEQLEMGFPRGAQPAPLLCSVLKASGSLQQLSLDSATFASPQDFGLVLQTLKEYNLSLKRLSFHDMNLADCQSEVLFLLQNLTLQEITFSFCRLFEKRPAQFLPEMVAAMKGNSTLKGLRLPGNRLGNAGLLALADVFSEDSSSSLCQLDISSNCIKPDGLLEFAKRLERWGRGAFGHLRLFQNWLDQDAVTAREAIRRLRATCHVVSDSWDSSQAFADYVSTM